jgi:phospholipid/cholesterol/gamma-HCH transport system substrate-binding protein
MAKKKLELTDLRVGLMTLIALLAVIATILTISGDINPFRREVIVKTRLSNVDGLRPGAEVRLAGVKVGKVRTITLLPVPDNDTATQTVELELALDPLIDGRPAGERVRQDSTVILGSVGLLGDKVVDITPGTLAATAVQSGDVIKGAQETTIRQLISGADDILANFTTLSASVKEIAEKINRGQGTVGKLVSDEALYDNLNRTVEEAQRLVQDIRSGKGTAARLINDPKLYEDLNATVQKVDGLLADIGNGKGTLGKLAKDEKAYNDLLALLERVDRTSAKIETTVARLERGEGTVGKLLTEDKLYRDTEQTLTNLNTVVARLERGEGSAGRLLRDPQLYDNLTATSAQANQLLVDFRQDPKKYLTIKLKIF